MYSTVALLSDRRRVFLLTSLSMCMYIPVILLSDREGVFMGTSHVLLGSTSIGPGRSICELPGVSACTSRMYFYQTGKEFSCELPGLRAEVVHVLHGCTFIRPRSLILKVSWNKSLCISWSKPMYFKVVLLSDREGVFLWISGSKSMYFKVVLLSDPEGIFLWISWSKSMYFKVSRIRPRSFLMIPGI